MLHCQRVWSVGPAESVAALANQLTEHTWCCCNGFQIGEYLFVNDATSPDRAQEYAVLKPATGRFVQIESITFSWMSLASSIDLIGRVLAGEFDNESYSTIGAGQIQTPEQHARCRHCA